MRTLGIDLAAQDKNTAYCVIDWTDDSVEVGEPVAGASDSVLLELMVEADWVGIDAPFGWPDDFVEAVHGYTTSGTWPKSTQPARMRHRETDRVVHDVLDDADLAKLWPLSVSSDRIAVCAWRCAGLLAAHAERTGWAFDRVGVPDADHVPGGVVAADGTVEVYPAAALAMWALPARGYKGSTASSVAERARREEIVDGLEGKAPWLELDDAVRDACIDDDDRLDALIASLIARAAATGRTLLPNRVQLGSARREGWIHLPAADAIFDLA